jgi:hypothetical protein
VVDPRPGTCVDFRHRTGRGSQRGALPQPGRCPRANRAHADSERAAGRRGCPQAGGTTPATALRLKQRPPMLAPALPRGRARDNPTSRDWARAEHRGETLGLGANALLNQFASLSQDTDLTFPLVHVRCQYGPWLAFPLCGVDREFTLVGQSMPPRRAGGQPLHPTYALPTLHLVVDAAVLAPDAPGHTFTRLDNFRPASGAEARVAFRV